MTNGGVFYSFGTSNPGAITLHNYPRHLQRRVEPDGSIIDLATTEILRDRERGVPRYNEFRRLVHRPPLTRFEELTVNKTWLEEPRRIYNDIEQVDLMIGMYAEFESAQLPKGFGFSDTAFPGARTNAEPGQKSLRTLAESESVRCSTWFHQLSGARATARVAPTIHVSGPSIPDSWGNRSKQNKGLDEPERLSYN